MRWFLSGMDDRAAELAQKHGLGYETAAFCYAPMMEDEATLRRERERTGAVPSGWFHAPFAELCPCAIDPLVREVTAKRYRQAMELSLSLGIDRVVVHGGFVPEVYFPEWFVEQSVGFWREFLKDAPPVRKIAVENVLEPEPGLLTEIVRQVDDPRLGLCLDVGHANLPKRATVARWVDTMEPWLFHVHLHNNDGIRDRHAPLGEGEIGMEVLVRRLLETDATITIENQNCEKSIEWLKEKGYLP